MKNTAVKAKGNTLTLKKLEKIYKEAKKYEIVCEICGKKPRFYYYIEGMFVGATCKKHEIK